MKIIGRERPEFPLAVVLCDTYWTECVSPTPVRPREFPCSRHLNHAIMLYAEGVRYEGEWDRVEHAVAVHRGAP